MTEKHEFPSPQLREAIERAGAPAYLWLDLETTGLEPEEDLILEIAAVATDEELQIVSVWREHIVGWPAGRVDHFKKHVMDPFVFDMHTKNGLFAAIEAAEEATGLPDIEYLDVQLLQWVLEVFGPNNPPQLAGASVHFDRGFCRFWLPLFEDTLHHRHYDVSSIKTACRVALGMNFPKAEAHRARADVEESLVHARACLAAMRRGR